MKSSLLIVLLVILALILGAIAAGAYFLFSTKTAATNFTCATSAKKPVIAAFGDSLVAGYGAPEQQGFVGPLSTDLGIKIINNGESGDTTAEALQRLPDVLKEKPDIVIVLLGGNDALQQIPVATTKANLSTIISTLQQNTIRVVLVGVLGGIVSDPYKPMFENLASTYNVAYVPNVLNGLLGNNNLMFDEVHPNATGYDLIAKKVYPAINKVCIEFEQ